MSDFLKPEGGYAKGTSRDPKTNGKPSAGITNESHGQLAPKGAGPGIPPNGTRIR